MKVLLATDGSKFSEAAVTKYCSLFDGSENTQVRIVSAAESTAYAIEPYGIPAAYYQEIQAASQKQASEAIREAEAAIRDHFPDLAVDLTTAVIDGSPARVIVEEAEKWGADLIIVGSHGYGFWQRTLIGSVSDSVARHAPCSVLVVRKPVLE